MQCCFKKETKNRQYVREQSPPYCPQKVGFMLSSSRGAGESSSDPPAGVPSLGTAAPIRAFLRNTPALSAVELHLPSFSLASRGFSFLLMSLYFSHKFAEYV